jgi:hypothetical protein
MQGKQGEKAASEEVRRPQGTHHHLSDALRSRWSLPCHWPLQKGIGSPFKVPTRARNERGRCPRPSTCARFVCIVCNDAGLENSPRRNCNPVRHLRTRSCPLISVGYGLRRGAYLEVLRMALDTWMAPAQISNPPYALILNNSLHSTDLFFLDL